MLRTYPAFRRLFAANVVSAAGDWLTYVAVGVLALGGPGGGLFDVAVVQLAHTVPQVLTAPLAGWLTDRVDHRALIAVASIARGLSTLAMALAAWRGALWAVELLLVLRMAGAAFVATPTGALVPRLVEAPDVGVAYALLGVAWAVVFTAGVVLGGLVTAWVGPIVALAADALTFVAAAALVARIDAPRTPEGAHPARIALTTDALAEPRRLFTAALKLPAQLVSGAAFVAMHALAATLAPTRLAIALGGLHALRGVANGVTTFTLRRHASRPRMAAIGSGLAIAGAIALGVALDGSLPFSLGWAALAMIAWGGGVGANWVGGTAALAEVVPAPLLGRYTALDLTIAALASAAGGVAYALAAPALGVALGLAPTAGLAILLGVSIHRAREARWSLAVALALAIVAVPAATMAQPAWLAAALEARALTDDDFVRTEVYSWTSTAQAARLAADGTLLRARAGDGASSPYQRALDELASSSDAAPGDAALARLLTSHPVIGARRYAWTTPYGTALPRGARGYGPVLIRIELDPDAWYARFAPEERPAFLVVDGRGAPVRVEAVLAEPARLASVLHVRSHDPLGGFREIVVHGGVVRWSVGTPGITARVGEDRRVLAALRRARLRPRRASHAAAWRSRAAARRELATLASATMAFDTPRHRPTEAALRALERALARRAPRVPRIEHPGPPVPPSD